MSALPEPFRESIRRQLGEASELFFESLEQPSPVSVRLHPFKNHPWENEEVIPWCAAGRYLATRPAFTLDPLLHAGGYYVQEASSMFLEQALTQTLDFSQPLHILDLCAAPGGKSTHVLSLMQGNGLLVANEAIRPRASVLAENIQKWGYANCVVTQNDPADFQRLPGFFDAVLVDAPCSGEGMFRKDPDARGEWSPQHVALCASRQRRILADAWEALREDGVLIYSTCTYNPAENEENLAWLTKQHNVRFVQLKTDPGCGVEEVNTHGITGYRFFPHRVRGEGLFLAIARKGDAARSRPAKRSTKAGQPATKVAATLRSWIAPTFTPQFHQFNDLVFFTPAEISSRVEQVLSQLHVVYAGTNAATVKHQKLIPAHALAMSLCLRREEFASCEVDVAAARAYLRREALAPQAGIPRGFALITFHNTALGWVNALQDRLNNLYPAAWRIRMTG